MAWTGSSQHIRIVLKVKVGREFLGDHPMGIMDHKGMTNLVTGISCASVPNLAAKKNTVSSLTEEALFFGAIPSGLVFSIRSTRSMAARDEFSGAYCLSHVIEIKVGGGNIDRHLQTRISP